MSDTPKNLRAAAALRWVLLGSAIALTAASGVLGMVEAANDVSPAPRSFVWGIAMVIWIAWIALSCSVLVIQVVGKRICRAEARILQAICEHRIDELAQNLGYAKVRPINRKG